MKFTFRKRVRIRADVDTVWRVVTSQQFEQDFLPEVSRNSTVTTPPAGMVIDRQVTWENGRGMDIALAREDLKVKIGTVQIELQAHRDEVYVTLQVMYEKRIEERFVKAHKAVKQLFTKKLNVLKSDLDSAASQLAFSRA